MMKLVLKYARMQVNPRISFLEKEGSVHWKAKGGILLSLKTLLLGICMRIRVIAMQMLIFMFSIYISEMFSFICPWPWLTRAQKLLQVSLGPNGNISLLFCTRDRRKHKTAMHLLTNLLYNLSVQTLDFIILLISSSFLWIICGLLSFLACPLLLMW